MGKFLATTLCGVFSLVSPAFADGFSFTDTVYSKWADPIGTHIEIVNNEEDDFAQMTNDMTGYSETCHPKEKTRKSAVFQCEGRIVKATYSKGVMHFDGVPYKQMKVEF